MHISGAHSKNIEQLMAGKKQSSPANSASKSPAKSSQKGVGEDEAGEVFDIRKPEKWNLLGRRGVLPPATVSLICYVS